MSSRHVGDWSLITGRGGGGGYKTGGGHMKYYLSIKGGGSGKSFSHAEGGDTKRFEVV